MRWSDIPPPDRGNRNTGDGPAVEWADLDAELAGDVERPEPTVLRREDRLGLLYRGEVNMIAGDSGNGKSWLTYYAAVEQLRAGHSVAILDYESTAPAVLDRLRKLGASDDLLNPPKMRGPIPNDAARLGYWRPVDPLTDRHVDEVCRWCRVNGAALVIIDSLGEAFGLDGVNENNDNEVGPWLRRVARRLADAGAAVLLVDHVTKSTEHGLGHPSGSKRKRAALTGAGYRVNVGRPLSDPAGGRLNLVTMKDRHGWHTAGATAASFTLADSPLGSGISAELWSPYTDNGSTSRPILDDKVAEAIVEAVAGEPKSQRALAAAVKNTGNGARAQAVRDTADQLVELGRLVEHSGPRGARIFGLPAGQEGAP